MKLGTVIAIVLVLVGCGVATTRMMSVGVPNDDLERAKKAMEDAEKTAKIERHYPAPMRVPPPPPPMSSREPIGGGVPIERREQTTVETKVDTVTRQLFSAALAFVIPEKANVDDSIKAQLLINPKKDLDSLKGELTKKGTVTAKEVKVSRVVKATIVAPDFDVTNITEEEQILADNESTEWLWSLSPKSSGAHEVNLTVTAVINSNGKESKHHIKSFEKTITINITAEQIIKNWFDENWKWVISTLIIPLLGFLFKDKLKKLLVG